MTQAKPLDSDRVDELQLAERFEIVKEWAMAAKEIAMITQDPEALELWSFINDRTALGVAMPEGGVRYFFTQEPTRPHAEYAIMTPLIKADLQHLPANDARRQLIEGKQTVAARYMEGSHAIYLPPANYGRLSKGVILLHEAKHAQLDIDEQVDRQAVNAHWLEEAAVFQFEFRVLDAFIGTAYSDLVQRVAKGIIPAVDDPNLLSPTYVAVQADEDIMAKGLQADTKAEIEFLIGTVVRFNAFWEYFKTHYDNPDLEFALFLKAAYKS